MKKKIANLIDLKSIITILITGAFIYGFIVGVITTDQFMTIAVMIYTFYFTKKNSKGDDEMATTDTRTEEEIKEQLKKDYQPIEVEEKKEEE